MVFDVAVVNVNMQMSYRMSICAYIISVLVSVSVSVTDVGFFCLALDASYWAQLPVDYLRTTRGVCSNVAEKVAGIASRNE